MQSRRLLAVAAPLVLAVVGCDRKPSPPEANDASAPASASADASASAAADASAGSDASASASAGDTIDASSTTACPAGMLLVDGDYCTEVRHKCKEGKSWYAKWNDKTICTEFEEPKAGDSNCVGKKVHKRYCVDKFEYPNKEGVRCTVMNDFPQAQRLCAEQGKRVCTETEWTMACEGPEYKPYPYGYARDPNVCKGDMSGVEPMPEGHDERGVPFYKFASKDKKVRADELAGAEDPASKYDNVTTGGPWRYGVRNQCRPKIYTHNEGFAYYYLSFRCCAEPDGKPTDPRAPKQIKRSETWRGGKAPVRDSWDGDPMPDPLPKAGGP